MPAASRSPVVAPAADAPARSGLQGAAFTAETASESVRKVADWILASGDNARMPYLIVDKVNARVFGFDAGGIFRGAAPALLGLARGDDNPPGIGDRKLSLITPAERITPAGRFVAGLGENLVGHSVLWVDHGSALSLHRVVKGTPAERRLARLATATALDNRISYGCINVPVAFYDRIIGTIFERTPGIVYVLPETRSLHDVFPVPIP